MDEKKTNKIIEELEGKINSLTTQVNELTEANQQLALSLNEALIIKDALITKIRVTTVKENK